MEVGTKPSKTTRLELIDFLSQRDGFKCYYCEHEFDELSEITIDHFYPKAHGGTWDIKNLRLACQPCNSLKSDTLPNDDGTVTMAPRVRKQPRAPRPEICNHCNSGRNLLEGEQCSVCGSNPQPFTFPRHRQRKPKNCNHDGHTHCWMCIMGLVPRKI